MLSACALIIFILEAQLPPLLPIPGIKLGLANIATLIAFYIVGKRGALSVLLVRIILGSIFTGNMMSMAFSIVGGSAAYIAMLLSLKFIGNTIAASICGAVAHNIGQILTALILTKTPQILYYLPILIIAAIVTGLFTGVICTAVIKILKNYGERS